MTNPDYHTEAQASYELKAEESEMNNQIQTVYYGIRYGEPATFPVEILGGTRGDCNHIQMRDTETGLIFWGNPDWISDGKIR